MWKPDKPLTKFDADQPFEVVWTNEFARAYYELCEGRADYDFIYELAAHLLPIGVTVDPRKVAELASIAVAFEMPDEE